MNELAHEQTSCFHIAKAYHLMNRLAEGLFCLTVLLLVGLGLYLGWSLVTKVEQGKSLQKVKWLPIAASNVSFARSYSWSYYVFDIPEEDFLRWATKWKLSEIQEPST